MEHILRRPRCAYMPMVAHHRDATRPDLAEEAAQEAFAIAADRWPRDGVPSSPRAWLMRTARNRATDRIRRDRVLATKFGLLVTPDPGEVPMTTTTFPDERLELIFTCCHPALAVEAQVALTLRTLGGLSTDEIARAFLVPERTMAQRLVDPVGLFGFRWRGSGRVVGGGWSGCGRGVCRSTRRRGGSG